MLSLFFVVLMVIGIVMLYPERPAFSLAYAGHKDAVRPGGRAAAFLKRGFSKCFAVTTALVNGPGSAGYPSQNYQEWTVISTADADTGTGAVTHAMGPAFARGFLKWLLGGTSPTIAQLSLWWFSTYPATTTWAASKATTAGSGNAGVQLRVEIQRAA